MDSEDASPEDLTRAYGAAAHAGDTEAMADLHGRLLKSYQKRDVNPASDTGDRVMAGLGHGMQRFSEGLANMVGAGPAMQKFSDAIKKVPILKNTPLASANFTDEGLKSEDQTARPLMDTGAGKVGDVMGQVAATAPLGLGTGALTKAAGPALAKAGTYLPGVFRTALAGGEGAVQGGAMADPEHQAAGAGVGAALGSGLSAVGSAIGKTVRGLVGKSEPAQRLMQDADEEGKDLFIPISQGGTGAAKQVYQKALPYALGVETQLAKQSKKAKDVVSEIAADRGMPAQADAAGTVQKTQAPIGDTMEDTAAGMRKTYDDAYKNTVKSYAFKPPDDLGNRVKDALGGLGLPKGHLDAITDHADNVLQEFMDADGTISGENLLRAKAAVKKTMPGLKSSNGSPIGNEEIADKTSEVYDGIVQDAINEHKTIAGGSSIIPEEIAGTNGRGLTFKSKNGETSAYRRGDALQVTDSQTTASAQGAGEGTARMNAILDHAQKNGQKVVSDTKVSGAAAKVYDRLEKQGYKVTRNPAEFDGSDWTSTSGRPVFEVSGQRTLSKAQQQAANVSRDLENYQRLGPSQAEGDAVASTSEANPADRGALKFGNLAKNAPENSSVKSLAQDAHEVLENESSGGVNPAGRHFLHGGEAVAALIHPGLAPGLIGGNLAGNALATKTVQKGLYGDLATQKAMAKFIRNNPQAAYSAGLAGRSAINAERQ